jgi:uncharacterized protein YcaQ
VVQAGRREPRSARWAPDGAVRFLAPFDPIVWTGARFELLWGWTYRFEAYTPAPKRKLGYYALPLLSATASSVGQRLRRSGRAQIDCGFIGKPMATRAFRSAFYAEQARMAEFLGL